MPLIHGFPPVAEPDAASLILGSMPGLASLQAAQYYAHPRNAFWRIMGELFGAGLDLPYRQRLARLGQARIALWDVIGACERAGSLDADIVGESVRTNDFAAFFAVHRGISRVFFNGGAAEAGFRRRVLPGLPAHLRGRLSLQRLPSTSPAHAALGHAQKLAAWSVLATPHEN